MSNDDEPSVMGAGFMPIPMPTEEEYKAAFKRRYIELLGEAGIPEHAASDFFDETPWDDIRGMSVEAAIADLFQYWDQE